MTTKQAETLLNPVYRAGFDLAQEHYRRGYYRPELNPVEVGNPHAVVWREGYEDGWAAAFYAKHSERHATLF